MPSPQGSRNSSFGNVEAGVANGLGEGHQRNRVVVLDVGIAADVVHPSGAHAIERPNDALNGCGTALA